MTRHFSLKNIDWIKTIKAGEIIDISGIAYAFRDQAHKRLVELRRAGNKLPVELKNKAVYYMGPTPPDKSGKVKAAGPTTSARMEKYMEFMLKLGQKIFIGKGELSEESYALLRKHQAVYLAAVGGAGAFLAKRLNYVKPVAFEDLGPEALFEIEFSEFPLIVVSDLSGNNPLYKRGKQRNY